MAVAPHALAADLFAGHSSMDDVISVYQRDVDRSLLRETLRRTPEERVRGMLAALAEIEMLRRAIGSSRR